MLANPAVKDHHLPYTRLQFLMVHVETREYLFYNEILSIYGQAMMETGWHQVHQLWFALHQSPISSAAMVYRDESRNGKIPYRPTPYTIYTDWISFLQENSKFRKNPGKSGKFGNEIGGSFFLTEFSVPVFYTGIPEFFPFLSRLLKRSAIWLALGLIY